MPCSTIDFYDVCVGIIIPLLSALIGGGMTMWGVVQTIKHEQKNVREQTVQASKPWVFYTDDAEAKKHPMHEVDLRTDGVKIELGERYIYIKNTDNGVGIITKLATKTHVYTPLANRVIEKSSLTQITLHIVAGESLEDMRLFISDVYGNEYAYEVKQVERKRYMSLAEIAKQCE